ncbi:DUF58 domain-containing protein [Candidatus Woesearchaeota archaeon]|nr:DUF58 domain-containing protein [Candidatus Woesearchaeota archaeon]
MIDTKFLDQLDRFSLIIHKRVTSSYTGTRKSVAPGHGLVIKDYRPYVPGDDFRSIDWRIYARTDDFFVRRYEEERNLVVHVIIDSSKSMDFGSGRTKFEFASMIGMGMTYLAMKENEKFQLSTFSDQLDFFRPRKGMNQLAAVLQYLNTQKVSGKSNFLEAMRHYKKLISNRALVVMISDFLFDADQIRDALYLMGKHDIKLIQVLDKKEKELKYTGDLKLHDSESRSILRTFISPRLRMKYRQKLDEHNHKIESVCDTLGAEFHQLTTDTPIFDAFYQILK